MEVDGVVITTAVVHDEVAEGKLSLKIGAVFFFIDEMNTAGAYDRVNSAPSAHPFL